jgi:PTH1 family peptidyl-tRNA hydrolase
MAEETPHEEGIRLVAGLGNVGERYANTRHNIGFMVVDELVRRYAGTLKKEKRLQGSLARVNVGNKVLVLLQPSTYMNLSGQAVQRVMNYYNIPVSQVLVVTDDVDLSFAQLRLRERGSAGSHNGLKSIHQHIGQDYRRLRMGVGDRQHGALHDHVLGRFTAKEQEQLGSFIDQAANVVERLCQEPIKLVMNDVNRRERKKPTSGTGKDLKAKAPEMGQESKNEQ